MSSKWRPGRSADAARRCCGSFRRGAGAGRAGAAAATLEEVLLHHALGDAVDGWRVADEASAVMMIPVPGAGICREVTGVDAARAVPGIESVVVTVKPGERLVPWPEGASYPGFIFARGGDRNGVVDAVRAAHACLTFDIAPELPLQRERQR